jgi:hypothetical protein
MPKSKKRYKKQKNKKSNRQIFDNGWMRAELKGKNIFMKNTLSAGEHDKWLKQLKTNRPLFYADIRSRIEKVVEAINSYDKIFVLGGISSYASQKMRFDETDDGASEIIMEYCQSISLATNNISTLRPNADNLKEIFESLMQIKSDMLNYYAIEHLEDKYTKTESDVRFKMIGETLCVRGEGYLKHIEELFVEMLSPHDEFFLKHYAFRPSDIIDTFNELESSFCLRLGTPNGMPDPFFIQKLKKWNEKKNDKENYPYDFLKENPGIAIEDGHPICYPINWLPYHDKLFRIRFINETQKKVGEALSMKFGDNEIFAKYSSYEPINETEIFNNPIIKSDEDFYLFSMNIAARNYFSIAQYLIKKADSNYYNQFFCGSSSSISRDNFIEKKVLSLFKKMLPNVEFHSNLKYKYHEDGLELKCAKTTESKYELDILGISESATYVIEVKAGVAEKGTKRGAIKTVKSDLRKIIGDAICQSYRAYRHILLSENSFFNDDKGKEILPINRKNVFRISVSFSYVGSIISSLNELKDFNVIDKSAEFAWAINIFDLIPFSELIVSEDQFIDYLSKRIPMYEDKRLSHIDEMNMLGLYFENDLKIDPAFKNSSSVYLNAYKDDIDNYFDYGGEKPVKKK